MKKDNEYNRKEKDTVRSVFNRKQMNFIKKLDYLSLGERLGILLGLDEPKAYLGKKDLVLFNTLDICRNSK